MQSNNIIEFSDELDYKQKNIYESSVGVHREREGERERTKVKGYAVSIEIRQFCHLLATLLLMHFYFPTHPHTVSEQRTDQLPELHRQESIHI